MTSLFERYLACSLTMAALTLLLYALAPLLGRRYRAKGLYVTWIVLLLGFLIPLRLPAIQPAVTARVPAAMARPVFQTSPARTSAADRNAVEPNASAGADETGPEPYAAPAVTLLRVEPSAPDAAPPFTWMELAAWIWLAGAAGTILLHTARHALFLRTVRRWQRPVTDAETLRILETEQRRMRIRGSVGLFRCPPVGTPMLTGLFRPKLLLPSEALTGEELRLVLRHELVHLKRRDLWIKAALAPATALHWFNPAVHLLARQLAFWQESACDEVVTAGESFEEKRFYSETIIRLIRGQARMKTLLTTSFYGGKYGVKRRIHAILEGGGKRVGAVLSGIALVSVACLGMAFAVDVEPEAASAAQTAATAYVSRKDAEGAPMVTAPTVSDLHIPIAAYFVGTPVTILDRRAGSALPEWGDAQGEENWAEVLVGGDGSTAGIRGWIPLAYLSDTPAELPTATLATDSVTGHVNLYTLNDTGSTLINAYRAGTRVTLLGRVQNWYQIELNGVNGFVQREYLTLDEAAQARFDTFRPDRFDDISRKRYQDILTFDALYAQKAAEYGGLGVESWSLEDKAWYGQMEETYIGSHDHYNQLPQAGDLQQADAVDIAWNAFITDCGLTDASRDDYDFNLRFYSIPDLNAALKKWEIRIRLKDGGASYSITLASPSGEVEERYGAEEYLREVAWEEKQAAYGEALTQWELERDLDFIFWSIEDKAAFSAQYGDGLTVLPDADAITQETAVALAREALNSRYGATDAELNAWKTGVNYRKEREDAPCWQVTFYDDERGYVATVTLDALSGQVIAVEDPYAEGNG